MSNFSITTLVVHLPDKPSELIRLALSDLKKVEAASDDYIVDMGEWHSSDYECSGKCAVCFAGSVISQTLHISPRSDVGPSSFDRDTCSKLSALNEFRNGRLMDGISMMMLDKEFRGDICEIYPKVVKYNSRNPLPFHEYMNKIATYLEGFEL